MTSEEYLRNQFDRLKKTEFGYSIKIFDGEGNFTNQMELTPNRAREILKILEEQQHGSN
tara:strand:- start:215 stop:391 length:177 start_codon:yes stop_codon:yes gene_type:complete